MVSYSISRILFGVFVANVGAGLAYAQIADTQPITTFSTVQFSEVSPPELTLKMAFKAAETHNPRILAAQQGFEIRKTDVRLARTGRLPVVEANASYGYLYQENEYTRATSSDISGRTSNVGLSLRQPLYSGNRVSNAVNRAESTASASKSQILTERQQVYLEVATAYFNVQRDLSILRLNEESLETLKEQLKANEKRYELSDTSLTDVARSKSAVATAYTRVASARASHAVSQSLLHRLTGLSGRRLAESITLPNTPSSPKSGFTKLLHNNSAIASARLTVEAAEYGVKEAKAMRLPSIELNSSVNRGRSPENFGTFSDDRTTTSARASISLRVPVFQADQEFAQVKRAKQVQQYNEIQLSHTIATARDNFSAIWDRFEASKLALASHDNAVEAAEVAAIGTRKIYQSGLISAIDLTETERILLESKIGRERAKYETFVNAYTLLSMIGEISSY